MSHEWDNPTADRCSGLLFVINLSLRKERFITIFLVRTRENFPTIWRGQVFRLRDLVVPLVVNGRRRVVCLLQIVTL